MQNYKRPSLKEKQRFKKNYGPKDYLDEAISDIDS